MRSFILIAALFAASVVAQEKGFFELTCAGTLKLGEGLPFGPFMIKTKLFSSLHKYAYERALQHIRCVCNSTDLANPTEEEFNRIFYQFYSPAFLLNLLEGKRGNYDVQCPGLANSSFHVVKNEDFIFQLPSTCNYAKWLADGVCSLGVPIVGFDATITLLVRRCDGTQSRLPNIKYGCTGSACSRLYAPCGADSDCCPNGVCASGSLQCAQLFEVKNCRTCTRSNCHPGPCYTDYQTNQMICQDGWCENEFCEATDSCDVTVQPEWNSTAPTFTEPTIDLVRGVMSYDSYDLTYLWGQTCEHPAPENALVQAPWMDMNRFITEAKRSVRSHFNKKAAITDAGELRVNSIIGLCVPPAAAAKAKLVREGADDQARPEVNGTQLISDLFGMKCGEVGFDAAHNSSIYGCNKTSDTTANALEWAPTGTLPPLNYSSDIGNVEPVEAGNVVLAQLNCLGQLKLHPKHATLATEFSWLGAYWMLNWFLGEHAKTQYCRASLRGRTDFVKTFPDQYRRRFFDFENLFFWLTAWESPDQTTPPYEQVQQFAGEDLLLSSAGLPMADMRSEGAGVNNTDRSTRRLMMPSSCNWMTWRDAGLCSLQLALGGGGSEGPFKGKDFTLKFYMKRCQVIALPAFQLECGGGPCQLLNGPPTCTADADCTTYGTGCLTLNEFADSFPKEEESTYNNTGGSGYVEGKKRGAVARAAHSVASMLVRASPASSARSQKKRNDYCMSAGPSCSIAPGCPYCVKDVSAAQNSSAASECTQGCPCHECEYCSYCLSRQENNPYAPECTRMPDTCPPSECYYCMQYTTPPIYANETSEGTSSSAISIATFGLGAALAQSAEQCSDGLEEVGRFISFVRTGVSPAADFAGKFCLPNGTLLEKLGDPFKDVEEEQYFGNTCNYPMRCLWNGARGDCNCKILYVGALQAWSNEVAITQHFNTYASEAQLLAAADPDDFLVLDALARMKTTDESDTDSASATLLSLIAVLLAALAIVLQ